MSTLKVMLAGKVEDVEQLAYPLYASMKIDGIRAYVEDAVVWSRNNKPIPNAHVQRMFGKRKYNGFDGELTVGNIACAGLYNRCQSVIMSHDNTDPQMAFWVFDDYSARGGYDDRYQRVIDRLGLGVVGPVQYVNQVRVTIPKALLVMEARALELGYEGVMVRSIDGPYKNGRSTTREGHLLKLKRFEDSEAVIEGVTALFKGGKYVDALGSINGWDAKRKQEVTVGSGFTDEERVQIWRDQDRYFKADAKFRYKFFPTGTHSAPRFPTWGGWRNDL